MPALTPVTLTGRFVQLEPLSTEHISALAAAASEDRSSYRWTDVPAGVDDAARYVDDVLALAAAGMAMPFAQRRQQDGTVVGSTRLFDFAWWRGRDVPDEVEVGGTWLAASAQRSALNSEAKLLLLSHAFEAWQVVRVAICTDERNVRSRTAIARLGATFEGILRKHRRSYVAGEQGLARNTAVFSITDDDWPAVKDRLISRLSPS